MASSGIAEEGLWTEPSQAEPLDPDPCVYDDGRHQTLPEYVQTLPKYVLMLVTVVATVTYGVGFNPPGGVWQGNDGVAGHHAGEPIVQATNKLRYLVFFYCNAIALTSSVLIIILFLLIIVDLVHRRLARVIVMSLRVLMLVDLLSLMVAYAAGSCRDTLTTVYTSALMAAGLSTYLTVQIVLWRRLLRTRLRFTGSLSVDNEMWFRKVLMLFSTFAVSITYVAGLNSPGGFWDKTGDGHRLGDAILNDGHHNRRLTTFFICNSTAFVGSLLILKLLLGRKLYRWTVQSNKMFGCVGVVLLGLLGAYASGSPKGLGSTTTSVFVMVTVGLVFFIIICRFWTIVILERTRSSDRIPQESSFSLRELRDLIGHKTSRMSRSLVVLLATFATSITYQAGLDPPGGVWQENGSGHLAGHPILLKMDASRYMTFLYCNSFAFVASLVTVALFLSELLLGVHMVESVMILELLGLMGAYAAGASRDLSTSINLMALAGAVLFYVVIHVVFFTFRLEQDDDVLIEYYYLEQAKVEKKRKLLYLLATLSTAVTYQAGLTPPGGFWLQDDNESGHHAGDPVLLFNHPRRYNAFFYCNSVSFMLSITTMILLVSPALYRPAIRSHALTFCTVAGMSCLIGAYAAGSTQHRTTSVGLFVLVAVAFLILVVLLIPFFMWAWRRKMPEMLTMGNKVELKKSGDKSEMKKASSRFKELMLLGILVAGVTYQAGLDPPGGVWQSDAGGHDAGGPAMLDNRKQRYLAFFYGNSTSFVSSILIILLLLQPHKEEKQHFKTRVMHTIVVIDLLALLVAYAAGSGRDWKTSVFVAALIMPILAYIAIKLVIALRIKRKKLSTQLESAAVSPV